MRRLAALLVLAALVAGCGGGKVETRPAPPAKDFPAAKGRTIAELLHGSGAVPSRLVVSQGR